MKNSFLFLLLFSFSIHATDHGTKTKVIKRYTTEECNRLGLTPIILPSGEKIMPMDDGETYRVSLNKSVETDSSSTKITPEQVINVLNQAEIVGDKIYSFLSLQMVKQMPIAIEKQMGGVSYIIGLDQLVFSPYGNTLKLYALIKTQNGQSICFAGNASFTGQGGIKEGMMSMVLGTYNDLELIKLKNIRLSLTSGNIKFDCNGFSSFSLEGNVIFDRKLIVPDDPFTGDPMPGNVRSHFAVTDVQDFNSMLINIDMQPFQLPNMLGYGFEVHKAVIDISDTQNATSFEFPAAYTAAESGNLWEGVYIGKVAVRFPRSFKKRKSSQRLMVGVNNLLIDRFGVSGEVLGENLLQLKEGDLNGWDYSLDRAAIVLVRNQVKSGSLEGTMRMSISADNTPNEKLLGYEAIIDPSRDYYNFAVMNRNTLEFDFLKASKVELLPSSVINLTLKNGEFSASAKLHGSLTIGSASEGVVLEKFNFQDLYVSTTAPRIKIGYFGGGSGNDYQLGNFPITLLAPSIGVYNNEVRIKFGLQVNLDKAGISAAGGFALTGAFEEVDGRHFWKNKSFDITSLEVAGDLSVCNFSGRINYFKNDPIYGKGFGGRLTLHLKTGSEATLAVAGLFGSTQSRYWFLDGMLIPSGTTSKQGLSIDFLAGTFFKHMKASPGAGGGNFKSLTGMVYVPDFNTSWGARFATSLTVGGKGMSGMAGMDITTRADGSLSKIGILGSVAIPSVEASSDDILNQYKTMCSDGDMMTSGSLTTRLDDDPNASNVSSVCNKFDTKDKGESGFSASILLKFDYDENSFYGKVGANFIAKGGMQIQGVGAFYFADTKWFVHLGEPPLNSRILVKIPSFPQIDGYIMLGHGISELPDPEPNIFEKYPNENKKRKKTNNPATVVSGKGIAFGAAISMGDQGKYSVVSYDVGVRAGVDIMLIRYPDGSYCLGRPGQGIGINNWRAGAQLYVIGWAKAAAFGMNVLEAELGAMLRGSTPNPTFATGQLAINFKMLFISYKFNVGFKLGEECEAVDGSDGIMEASEMIAETYPNDGDYLPKVTTKPSVSFLYDVEKPISMDGIEGKTRIKITDFSIKSLTYNQDIAATWEQDANNPKKVNLLITGNLPDYKTSLQATIRATVQLQQNGVWTDMEIDGKKVTQQKSFIFSTGTTSKDVKDDIHQNTTNAVTTASGINQAAENVVNGVSNELENKEKAANLQLNNANTNYNNSLNAANTIIDSLPLTPQGKEAAKNTVATAQGKKDAVINNMQTSVTTIFKDADAKIDTITKEVLGKVDTLIKDMNTRITGYVVQGTQNVDSLQQGWDTELATNKHSYEANLTELSKVNDIEKLCKKLNISITDYALAGTINSTLGGLMSRFSFKEYDDIQKGVVSLQAQNGISSMNYTAYNYCSYMVSGPGSLVVKNEMTKKYNDEANRICGVYIQRMIATKTQVGKKSNEDLVETHKATNQLLNDARQRCKDIMDNAVSKSNALIADATLQCDKIMKDAFTKCDSIINASKSAGNQVAIDKLVSAYTSKNKARYKQEDYEANKDGKYLFSSIASFTPSTSINNSDYPAATSLLEKGKCMGISQQRENTFADGFGGNYKESMYDNTCPASYSQLEWDTYYKCYNKNEPSYVFEVSVKGLASESTVSFSLDEGHTWQESNNSSLGFVTTRTMTRTENLAIWVAASDVGTNTPLKGLLAACPTPPPTAGTLLTQGDCIGFTQKRTYVYADGSGGVYSNEVDDATCPTAPIAKGTFLSLGSCIGLTQKRNNTYADGNRGTYTELETDFTCPSKELESFTPRGILLTQGNCLGLTQWRTNTYADGDGATYVEEVKDYSCPSPRPRGEVISRGECIGFSQKRTTIYTDGTGATYADEVFDNGCPYVHPSGELISQGPCRGFKSARINTYADGNGGSYTEEVKDFDCPLDDNEEPIIHPTPDEIAAQEFEKNRVARLLAEAEALKKKELEQQLAFQKAQEEQQALDERLAFQKAKDELKGLEDRLAQQKAQEEQKALEEQLAQQKAQEELLAQQRIREQLASDEAERIRISAAELQQQLSYQKAQATLYDQMLENTTVDLLRSKKVNVRILLDE